MTHVACCEPSEIGVARVSRSGFSDTSSPGFFSESAETGSVSERRLILHRSFAKLAHEWSGQKHTNLIHDNADL